jgi:MscS family membrane protein
MGLALLIGLVVTWVELVIYRKLLPRFSKTRRVWDDAILRSAHRPILFLLWFFVLSWVWRLLIQLSLGHALVDDWGMLYRIALIGFIFALLQFYISHVQKAIIAKANKHPDFDVNKTTVSAVCMLGRVLVIVMVVLVLMQSLGIKMSALLAFGGASTLVVGLAAKDTLANFFGGFMIFVDRPFEVGDWVASPDRLIEGTVEHIGWRLTRIRAFDKRPLYVPNGVFSTIVINNPSRMSNRRIKATVGVRYDDANVIAPMLADVEKMLNQHPDIDQTQTTFVKLVEFGASSLNFLVYTFTKTTEWVKYQAIQQDVFLKIIEIIAQHGAECAFPTTTLEVPQGIEIAMNPEAAERS